MTQHERIAVLGTGELGTALARRLVRAGLEVVPGSRDHRRGAPYREAVASASIVVLAIGYEDLPPALDQLRDLLDQRIVVDPTTPWGTDVDVLSAAERIALQLPGVPLVGAWKASHASILDARAPAAGHDVFLCGDDPDANQRVAAIVSLTECRPVDCGSLSAARTIEGMVRLMATIRTNLGTPASAGCEWKFVVGSE